MTTPNATMTEECASMMWRQDSSCEVVSLHESIAAAITFYFWVEWQNCTFDEKLTYSKLATGFSF